MTTPNISKAHEVASHVGVEINGRLYRLDPPLVITRQRERDQEITVTHLLLHRQKPQGIDGPGGREIYAVYSDGRMQDRRPLFGSWENEPEVVLRALGIELVQGDPHVPST